MGLVKNSIKTLPLPLVILSFILLLACDLMSQTFTTLHTFAGKDGAYPLGGLAECSNTLYGTTSSGIGTIFSINKDGTGFKTLHAFVSSEGASPSATLSLDNKIFYGTAQYGGSYGGGTVFSINSDGTGFLTLYSLNVTNDGTTVWAGTVVASNTLYGVAGEGGSPLGSGTLFSLNSDGTGFRVLYKFANGGNPYAGLILSDGILYGATQGGGSFGKGTIFSIKIDGSSFTELHTFSGIDGAYPKGALVLSAKTLYGTTLGGGKSANGSVFALNKDGSEFTNLYSFTAGALFYTNGNAILTNSDGAFPWDGLVLSGEYLYGTTSDGGCFGSGTVFSIKTDASEFRNLYNFSPLSVPAAGGANRDGAWPYAGLTLSGNALYGTTWNGGTSGKGTVFSLSFTPQLTISQSGTNVILSWPTNDAGFDYSGYSLQSTTNLDSFVWITSFPAPVVIKGQNVVTNPTLINPLFFRLSQ